MQMPPPSQPSPTASEYEPCQMVLTTTSEMAHNLLPSPGLHQKTEYPPVIQDLESYFADGQGFVMRSMPPAEPLSINSNPVPWVPIRREMSQPNVNHSRFSMQPAMFTTMSDACWRAPTSDVESSLTSRDHRDSGYYSHNSHTGASGSLSYEPQASNIDCQSLTGRVNEMDFAEERKFYPDCQQATQFAIPQHSAQPAQVPQQPAQVPQQQHVEPPLESFRCTKSDCSYEAKKHSDLKYVLHRTR